jgi:hypothetical protein
MVRRPKLFGGIRGELRPVLLTDIQLPNVPMPNLRLGMKIMAIPMQIWVRIDSEFPIWRKAGTF